MLRPGRPHNRMTRINFTFRIRHSDIAAFEAIVAKRRTRPGRKYFRSTALRQAVRDFIERYGEEL